MIDEYNATEESAIEIALLVEFMKFFNLKNTLSVFEAEMKLVFPVELTVHHLESAYSKSRRSH